MAIPLNRASRGDALARWFFVSFSRFHSPNVLKGYFDFSTALLVPNYPFPPSIASHFNVLQGQIPTRDIF